VSERARERERDAADTCARARARARIVTSVYVFSQREPPPPQPSSTLRSRRSQSGQSGRGMKKRKSKRTRDVCVRARARVGVRDSLINRTKQRRCIRNGNVTRHRKKKEKKKKKTERERERRTNLPSCRRTRTVPSLTVNPDAARMSNRANINSPTAKGSRIPIADAKPRQARSAGAPAGKIKGANRARQTRHEAFDDIQFGHLFDSFSEIPRCSFRACTRKRIEHEGAAFLLKSRRAFPPSRDADAIQALVFEALAAAVARGRAVIAYRVESRSIIRNSMVRPRKCMHFKCHVHLSSQRDGKSNRAYTFN